jgi:DNA-directed RNA polymerase delta subunit
MKDLDLLNLNSIIVRNDKNFMISPIGDELVMMNMENGSYIGINEVGTAIWEKLEQPRPVTELINYLLEMYDIEREECEKRTIKYLTDLIHQGMLIVIK